MTAAHGWRPIAEAPRDGMPFLAWNDRLRCVEQVRRFKHPHYASDAVINPHTGKWWRAKFWVPHPGSPPSWRQPLPAPPEG